MNLLPLQQSFGAGGEAFPVHSILHAPVSVGYKVALLSLVCLAVNAIEGDLIAIEKDPQQIKSNLEHEQQFIEHLSEESQSLLTKLDELDQKFGRTNREWRDAQRLLQEAEQALVEQQAEIARVNQELLAARARLRSRLRGLYKRGELGWLGLIFDAQSVSAALRSVSLIERAARSDQDLIASSERLRATLAESERRLVVTRQKAQALEGSVRRQRDLVLQSAAEKHRALTLIRGEKILHLRAVKELNQASKNLSHMVATIKQPVTLKNDFDRWQGRLPSPLAGARIEVRFGRQVDPRFKTETLSQGVDLRAEKGAPVRAVYQGVVAYAEPLLGYGLLAIIDHGGSYYTLYGHLDHFQVQKGQTISQGQPLGTLGDSGSLKGAYLYFEVRHGGRAVDPEKWVKF
jgi:Membrane-bound metallopeptidase